MEILWPKPTVYVSHPIEGNTGNVVENCKRARKTIDKVSLIFPEVHFYVPASENLVNSILLEAGKVSEADVLWADLQILQSCHGYIYLKWEDSHGGNIELKDAIRTGLTTGRKDIIKDDLYRASYQEIRRRLTPCVNNAVQRFRSRHS